MHANKISGWLLLLVGLGIILFGVYSSFDVFSGKKPAPEIFPVEETKKSLRDKDFSENEIQKQIETAMEEQLREMIPVEELVENIPRLLNLLSWSIFAGILIFAGAQISSIGVKLIKK